jgi:RNA polymerase sigma-70 factor (ECF subfamily)
MSYASYDADFPVEMARLTELIAAARNGSSEALGEALQITRRVITAMGYARVHKRLRHLATDSTRFQDAAMLAVRDFHQFEGTTGSQLCTWIFQIVYHLKGEYRRTYLLCKKRSVGREVRIDELTSDEVAPFGLVDDELDPRDAAEKAEERQLGLAAIEELPAEEKQVLELRYLEDLSWNEIESYYGKYDGWAQKTCDRAKKMIRALIARKVFRPGKTLPQWANKKIATRLDETRAARPARGGE